MLKHVYEKMKRTLVLVLSILLALTCVGCGSKSGTSSTDHEYGDDIVFGLTAPVTGAQAAGGEQAQKGMELAIEEINNNGGIKLSDGYHKIKLLVEDDQGDATICDTTVRRLVSNGAAVIFGPYFSGMTIALDKTMNELQVPLINSATSIKIAALKNEWIWHDRCDDGINVLALGKQTIEDYKAKNNGSTDGLVVGIVCCNDETGTSAAESYKKYFDEQGVKYYVDLHNKDDSDLTAYVQKAVAAGCNAWVSSTHDVAAVALAKAMYEAGLRDQIVYMNPILAQAQVLAMMEPEWVEGWGCVADYSATDTTNEKAAAFTKAWTAKYGTNPTPDVQGCLFYCHTMLAVKAIEDADSYEPAKINEALHNINGYETIIGTVYAGEYSDLIYEIGIAKIKDLEPEMTGRVSMAKEYGFGE